MFFDVFAIIFGKDEPALKRLHSLPREAWAEIASPHSFEADSIAVFSYEHQIVKDAIYYIKNKRDKKIAEAMCVVACDHLLEELSELEMTENFASPVLVPVPTSYKRKLRRGFNPSEFIAENLSRSGLALPVIVKALRKTRETKPQKELSRSARLSNVRGSIEADPGSTEKIRGRNIIVVDDVATTGSTLGEARRALLSSGAKKVLCLALAH